MQIVSKATKFLKGFTLKFWLIVCAVLIACLPVAYCKGVSDGKAIEAAAQTKAENKALKQAREADEDTNQQRQDDQERNTENANRRENAARDGGRRAANCERLRQAGLDTPSACD